MCEHELQLVVIAFLFAFTAGATLAKRLTESKWRRNADEVYRIESGGRLYKVNHAQPSQVLADDDI